MIPLSMKWEIPVSMLIIAFLIASIIWMVPQTNVPKPDGHTKNFHTVITREENIERKDYVDDDGKVQIAGDVGYATVISTISENNRLEQYYDEYGAPIKRYSGYYAILREYDEEGHNYHISYLGLNNEPITTSNGYSDIYRTFYETGKIRTEKYYDSSGNPVCNSTYGYGCFNEYDGNGNKVKTIYLDEKDQPKIVGLGYAIIILTYHISDGQDNGKVEYEFYYDENRQPIAQSLGHYGVYKADYDIYGQNALLTYLDEDGQPMNTTRGYATVVRTYYTDGARRTERYFDANGLPYRLPDGQYGEKYENNQVIYLDINGNEQFSLRRLLYNHLYFVIVFALIVIILAVCINRRMNLLLALLYCAIIGYMTLLFRETISRHENYATLWSYRRFFTDDEARLGILKNIWLFIPLGAILSQIRKKKAMIFIPIGLSILIEIVQRFTLIGYCELDDIISNSLGGMIGYVTGLLLNKMKKPVTKEQ